MSFKGAIFDMDGVVTTTVPFHFKAWKRMFNEYGKEFTFDDYQKYVDGIPRMDGARAILSELSEDELKEAGDKKQGYFLELLNKEEILIYDSTIAFIKELRSKDIKIAVISSSKNCPYILEKTGVDKLTDIVISGNDITKGKPDPQIFLLAAKGLGLNEDECVVFEDALLGVEAAKNGNFRCIGIDRHNNPARLKKADLIVDDLSRVTYIKIEKLFKK